MKEAPSAQLGLAVEWRLVMETLYTCCCGLDVHLKTVVACLLKVVGQKAHKQVRVFKTMTQDILALSDWLQAEDCTHVAMESTGVYTPPQCDQNGDRLGVYERYPAYGPSRLL